MTEVLRRPWRYYRNSLFTPRARASFSANPPRMFCAEHHWAWPDLLVGRTLSAGWGLMCVLAVVVLSGCGGGDAEDEFANRPAPALTYICVETGAVEEGGARTWPYRNPATGRDTFLLHLYSEGAKRWFPVPPPGPGRGNPMSTPCPKTGQPMSAVGPKPTKANVSTGRTVKSDG